jgi:hypothetical protein
MIDPRQVPLPYTTGSTTSKDAASDATPRASKQRTDIWECLRTYGPQMYEQICDRTGLPVQSVTTRLTQMRDAGMVAHVKDKDGTNKTAMTTTMSKAAIYTALPHPWTPVPRIVPHKDAQKIVEQARSIIRVWEARDGMALREALTTLRVMLNQEVSSGG